MLSRGPNGDIYMTVQEYSAFQHYPQQVSINLSQHVRDIVRPPKPERTVETPWGKKVTV